MVVFDIYSRFCRVIFAIFRHFWSFSTFFLNFAIFFNSCHIWIFIDFTNCSNFYHFCQFYNLSKKNMFHPTKVHQPTILFSKTWQIRSRISSQALKSSKKKKSPNSLLPDLRSNISPLSFLSFHKNSRSHQIFTFTRIHQRGAPMSFLSDWRRTCLGNAWFLILFNWELISRETQLVNFCCKNTW